MILEYPKMVYKTRQDYMIVNSLAEEKAALNYGYDENNLVSAPKEEKETVSHLKPINQPKKEKVVPPKSKRRSAKRTKVKRSNADS